MNDRFVSILVMTSQNPEGKDLTISVDQAIETYPEIEPILRLPGFKRLYANYGNGKSKASIDVQLIEQSAYEVVSLQIAESHGWEPIMPGVWRVSKNEIAPS